MTAKDSSEAHWTPDKRIPIALILAVLLQTAGIIWWASTIASRIGVLEDKDRMRLEEVRAVRQKLDEQLTDIAKDIATLKANGEAAKDQTSDIKRSIDALTQQLFNQKRSDVSGRKS